jgi:FdhD protein
VERAVLLGLIATLLAQPRLYRETGGLHAAAIFHTDGRLVAIREDIGRHNAVDKAIGYALLRGIVLDDKLLLTTGRASHEMVTKAVRAGVPVLASVSSPTSLAVQLAQRLNVTLIGYLRGQRMNVYTHRERVDSGA